MAKCLYGCVDDVRMCVWDCRSADVCVHDFVLETSIWPPILFCVCIKKEQQNNWTNLNAARCQQTNSFPKTNKNKSAPKWSMAVFQAHKHRNIVNITLFFQHTSHLSACILNVWVEHMIWLHGFFFSLSLSLHKISHDIEGYFVCQMHCIATCRLFWLLLGNSLSICLHLLNLLSVLPPPASCHFITNHKHNWWWLTRKTDRLQSRPSMNRTCYCSM